MIHGLTTFLEIQLFVICPSKDKELKPEGETTTLLSTKLRSADFFFFHYKTFLVEELVRQFTFKGKQV